MQLSMDAVLHVLHLPSLSLALQEGPQSPYLCSTLCLFWVSTGRNIGVEVVRI